MLAFEEDRHEDHVIRRVGVPQIGIVVEKRIPGRDVVVEIAHRLGLQRRTEDMNGKALAGSQQAIVARTDAAREIPNHRENRRARRAQQGVRHLAFDGIESIGENRHQHRVH